MKYLIIVLYIILLSIYVFLLLYHSPKDLNIGEIINERIDSICIRKSEGDFMICNQNTIDFIDQELHALEEAKNVYRLGLNEELYQLAIYVKGASEPLVFTILSNHYSGIQVTHNKIFYRGDHLNKMILRISEGNRSR